MLLMMGSFVSGFFFFWMKSTDKEVKINPIKKRKNPPKSQILKKYKVMLVRMTSLIVTIPHRL